MLLLVFLFVIIPGKQKMDNDQAMANYVRENILEKAESEKEQPDIPIPKSRGRRCHRSGAIGKLYDKAWDIRTRANKAEWYHYDHSIMKKKLVHKTTKQQEEIIKDFYNQHQDRIKEIMKMEPKDRQFELDFLQACRKHSYACMEAFGMKIES